MSNCQLKWSDGIPYEKSARQHQQQVYNREETDTRECAIAQSLEFAAPNRREHLDEKISSRELMPQRAQNPFSQSSYANDVVVRDMYLKPINTSAEKELKTSEPRPDNPPSELNC